MPVNPVPKDAGRRCIFDYTCPCGAKFSLHSELKDHYFKCEKMKSMYGELFTMIVKYNHKNLGISEKMSLNAIIDMFCHEIKSNIINEMRRQELYIPPQYLLEGPPCNTCAQRASQPAQPGNVGGNPFAPPEPQYVP